MNSSFQTFMPWMKQHPNHLFFNIFSYLFRIGMPIAILSGYPKMKNC